MPNRFVQKNGSTVELLTRVPMNRGSLLKSIDNLLKTIETSENAVMIPTLLKDKVRVDACELLFVAKILKASILGHSDLVEFYMNHIGHTSSLLQQPSQALHNDLFSPTTRLQPSPLASPLLSHSASSNTFATATATARSEHPQHSQQASDSNNTNNSNSNSNSNNNYGNAKPNSVSSTLSTTSSTSSSIHSSASSTTTTTGGAGAHAGQQQQHQHQLSVGGGGGASVGGRSSAGSSSWVTASQQQHSNGNSPLSSGASFISITSSNETPTSAADQLGGGACGNSLDITLATMNGAGLPPPDDPMAHEALLATASKSLLVRQAQPPSLLQLTTTNNHINSMSDMFTQASQQLSPTLEQLTSQLASMQQQQQQLALSTNGSSGGIQFEGGALSISTSAANTTLDQFIANGGQLSAASTPTAADLNMTTATVTPAAARQPQAATELRSSRSAGCLFRANSGASSPRTPNTTTPGTPYPQAETLAGATSGNGLVGDPKALIKLLLQVEQLKSSISHVTTLLESVVELYKKSIDNIA